MIPTNVKPGDVALLFYPCHQENKGRVCTVLRVSSYAKEPEQGPWWLVEFSNPVVTDAGPTTLSNIPDWRLRLLTRLVKINTFIGREDRPFGHPA